MVEDFIALLQKQLPGWPITAQNNELGYLLEIYSPDKNWVATPTITTDLLDSMLLEPSVAINIAQIYGRAVLFQFRATTKKETEGETGWLLGECYGDKIQHCRTAFNKN